MGGSGVMRGVVCVPLCSLGPVASRAPSSAVGKPLPGDAAPPEQQVITGLTQPATTLDFFVSVYKRPQNVDGNSWSNILSTPLVRLDKNFNLAPSASKTGGPSKYGLTGGFHRHKPLIWSDGTP